MIHLIRNLYSVEVPSDAKKLIKIKYDFNGNYMLESICDKFKLKIPFDFKILGEVSKDEISFDVEPYVEIFNKGLAKRYVDYMRKWLLYRTPKESFRSLLQSKGIYFENPIQKPDVTCLRNEEGFCQCGEESVRDCRDLKWKWQESQKKVIKGKLIILEKL